MIQISGGIVWNKLKGIVVVNQNNNSWSLPKGHVEEGEDNLAAAIREIKEELDLDLDENQIVYIGENKHDYGFKKIHILLYQYNLDQPVFKLADHDQSAWIDQTNYKKFDISDADQPFLVGLFK